MSYRSVLVFLDNANPCLARIRLGIRLARDHDAHLIGLAPTGTIGIPPQAEVATALADYAALAWNQLRGQAEWAVQRFRDECEAAGISAYEALIDEADQASSLVSHARCCDLALVSNASPRPATQPLYRELVDELVLRSARPTLVVPPAWQGDRTGTRILVAWDDSREAARALNDALPLLRLAIRVEMVFWRESELEDEAVLRANLNRVHRWLAWHGVVSHAYVATASHGVPQAMRTRASEMNADLIVMGAYSHARWTQRVLGGTTRSTLAMLNVPALMSH